MPMDTPSATPIQSRFKNAYRTCRASHAVVVKPHKHRGIGMCMCVGMHADEHSARGAYRWKALAEAVTFEYRHCLCHPHDGHAVGDTDMPSAMADIVPFEKNASRLSSIARSRRRAPPPPPPTPFHLLSLSRTTAGGGCLQQVSKKLRPAVGAPPRSAGLERSALLQRLQ